MKQILCDVCNKEMTDNKGMEFPGVKFTLNSLKTDKVFSEDFQKKQCGEYELNKEYYICVECYLKHYGIKP